MNSAKLFPMEYRFMEIIWEAAPLSAGRLAMLAQSSLNWKRTTSYTVLKRLTDRGLVLKTDKMITPLLTKTEADEAELAEICDRCYGGSYEAMAQTVIRLANAQKEAEKNH